MSACWSRCPAPPTIRTTIRLYQGNQWNQPFQNPALAEADVILVIDSDVPWIPTVSRPAAKAAIYHIDVDPLKQDMPLWYIEARRSFQADATLALRQMNAAVAARALSGSAVAERTNHYATRHAERAARLCRAGKASRARVEIITPEYLTACVRRQIGADAIVLNEGITNYAAICDHIAPTKPGVLFASGGGSLGWNGGAAIGAKLASPESTVVALTGDGSYMFSLPSTVHWMARQYKTPFLQIVYNNRGWKAPKFSTLAVHPDGYASRADDIDVAFDRPGGKKRRDRGAPWGGGNRPVHRQGGDARRGGERCRRQRRRRRGGGGLPFVVGSRAE